MKFTTLVDTTQKSRQAGPMRGGRFAPRDVPAICFGETTIGGLVPGGAANAAGGLVAGESRSNLARIWLRRVRWQRVVKLEMALLLLTRHVASCLGWRRAVP